MAPLDERIGNDGSHAATNDYTTEELFEIVRKQEAQISELRSTLSQGTDLRVLATEVRPQIPASYVKVKGKNYQWAMPVFVLPKHGRITAEEAATDKKIIDDILAMEGQGILVEKV